MPKVHCVKKARADNPAVKRGESYYWWKFPFKPKLFSKTYPTRSQLTLSDYLGCVYDLQDSISDYNITGVDDFHGMFDELRDQVGDIRDQCEESFNNMRVNLHVAKIGRLLTTRIRSCGDALVSLAAIELAGMPFDSASVDDALSGLDAGDKL